MDGYKIKTIQKIVQKENGNKMKSTCRWKTYF